MCTVGTRCWPAPNPEPPLSPCLDPANLLSLFFYQFNLSSSLCYEQISFYFAQCQNGGVNNFRGTLVYLGCLTNKVYFCTAIVMNSISWESTLLYHDKLMQYNQLVIIHARYIIFLTTLGGKMFCETKSNGVLTEELNEKISMTQSVTPKVPSMRVALPARLLVFKPLDGQLSRLTVHGWNFCFIVLDVVEEDAPSRGSATSESDDTWRMKISASNSYFSSKVKAMW